MNKNDSPLFVIDERTFACVEGEPASYCLRTLNTDTENFTLSISRKVAELLWFTTQVVVFKSQVKILYFLGKT